jgi:hypothetical protein
VSVSERSKGTSSGVCQFCTIFKVLLVKGSTITCSLPCRRFPGISLRFGWESFHCSGIGGSLVKGVETLLIFCADPMKLLSEGEVEALASLRGRVRFGPLSGSMRDDEVCGLWLEKVARDGIFTTKP